MKTHRTFAPRRLLAAAVALGTLAALLLAGQCSFGRACDAVRSQTLRLHVLANSDAAADQALKLQVRDALVAQCAVLFDGVKTLAEAEALAAGALPVLQRTAEAVVRQAGCDQSVDISLATAYFNTRTYDDYTLPAGQYRALQVRLGEAAGKNWWCVLFPPLCIPAAEADVAAEAEAVWGADGVRLVTGDYQLRFALVEWLQRLLCQP